MTRHYLISTKVHKIPNQKSSLSNGSVTGEKITSFSAYTEVHKILFKNSKEIKKSYRSFISFQLLRHQVGLPESTHALLKEVLFIKDPATCIMHRIYFKLNKDKCQWNLCLLNTIEKHFCYIQRHHEKHPEGIKNEWICLFIIVAHTIVQFLHSHKLHCIGSNFCGYLLSRRQR